MSILLSFSNSHELALLKFLRIPSLVIGFLLVYPFQTNAQVLTFVEAIFDNAGGVDGLDNTFNAFVSPDGAHVYVAGNVDDAVAVFSRNSSTGALTFIEVYNDGVNGVDGLNGARNVIVSPDGAFVYVTGQADDAVAVFSRNSSTGALTFIEVHKDGINGVDGLNGAVGLLMSPDENHIYVAGNVDDAISVFSRNSGTGALTFVEVLKDGVNGVDGLNGITEITISPDGSFVYAPGQIDDAISVFSRNSNTGALTFVEVLQDGVNGVDGLNQAITPAISPDGAYLYVASRADSAIAVFSRNTSTGTLTFVEVLKNGVNNVDGLAGATRLTVSPGGNYVYAVAFDDSALTVFSRNSSTGALTFEEVFRDGIGGVDGLEGANGISFSPDGAHVYVQGTFDDGMAVFSSSEIVLNLSRIAAQSIIAGKTLTVQPTATLINSSNTITYSGSNLPSGATVDASTGVFTWEPAPSDTGSHTVTITASTVGTSDFETFDITVNPFTAFVDLIEADTAAVSAASGGTVTIGSAGVYTKTKAVIFSNSLSANQTIILKSPDPSDLTADQINAVPSATEFLVVGSESGFTFDNDINVVLEYKDFEINTVESNMRVHVWDAVLSIWKRVEGTQTVNATDNTVTAATNHFSIFGVLEVTDTSSVQPISVGWNMVSLPVDPDDTTDPEDIFSDNIDPFRSETGNSNIYAYDEPTGEWTIPSALENGRGYILYGFNAINVDANGLEQTADITKTLSNGTGDGWNLLGNPYAVAIDWDTDFTRDAGIDAIYYRWTGSQYEFYPGGGLTAEISPWQGFFAHTNIADEELTITYPGVAKRSVKRGPDFNWRIQLKAESGELRDDHNYLGLAPSAASGYDGYDAYELLPLGEEFISLYFAHEDWGTNAGNYTQDIRVNMGESITWEFTVSTNVSANDAVLTWTIPHELDADASVVLTDLFTNEEVDMRSTNRYVYAISALGKEPSGVLKLHADPVQFGKGATNTATDDRKFSITVGSNNDESDGVIPGSYFLDQNYPNPFNPSTTIKFGLPESGQVSIKIFNLLGQEVRTLINTELSAGFRTVVWDGRNNAGFEVASGMYVYQIRAGNFSQVKKLLLIR